MATDAHTIRPARERPRRQMRPEAHALRRLRELGIRVEVLPTDQAVRRFGELNPAGTAAALHLTC